MTNAPTAENGGNLPEASPPLAAPSANPPDAMNRRPITQQARNYRRYWPAWMKQMPYLRLPAPKDDFSLIDRAEMRKVLGDTAPEVIRAIERDLDLLEADVSKLFSRRDAQAAQYQNRFRLYQVGYIILAMIATLLGSLMVLALNNEPRWVPVIGFGETVIALLATFLASLSGRGENPLSAWLDNRRRAENLRREFFRYLMKLPPYDALNGAARRTTL